MKLPKSDAIMGRWRLQIGFKNVKAAALNILFLTLSNKNVLIYLFLQILVHSNNIFELSSVQPIKNYNENNNGDQVDAVGDSDEELCNDDVSEYVSDFL